MASISALIVSYFDYAFIYVLYAGANGYYWYRYSIPNCAKLLNEQIISVEILDSKLGTVLGLVGSKIASVARHGKVLGIRLDNDVTLLLHLRMTGRLQWQTGQQALPPHTRFVMTFSTGTWIA